MTGLSAQASGLANQANFGGDNYAPIYFDRATAPAPSLHQLPPGISDFSGRDANIAEIERLASNARDEPCIVNVFGAPGIGKTALTTHVAHRLAKRLDEIQLYAELGEVDGEVPTSTQVLQRFVAALDPATIGIPVSAQELPARYRSLLSERRCLIVLDNAQNADQITDLIPGTSSTVLVTSRASLTAVDGVIPYHLELMSRAESLALLSSVSRRTWEDDRVARTLVDQCGRLPLALRVVGAILKKKPHWTLEKVATVLAEEQTRLARLTEGQLDIRGSFEVSYRQLSADEANAFRLFSLLPLARFKLRHATSFLQRPEDYADQLLEALVDAQLLETDDGRYFRFHDLLRLYAQERSQAADDDPGGALVARFLRELTDEFMQAYTQCHRETTWTVPWARRGWPAERDQETRVQAKLDALYVPARLVPEGKSDQRAGSWEDLLARWQRVLITGAGGTGKTVLANRICYEIAVATRPYDVGFTVPLRQRSDRDPDLETLIASAVRSQYRLDLSQETVRTLLRDRRAVVIFDGLDEVPPSDRDQAIRDIVAFSDRYPSAKVVVTSRPGKPRRTLEKKGFSPYAITPLTTADVASYVERWQQVVRTEPGSYAPLLRTVSSPAARRGWLSTPLLITQLLAMYDRTGVVPESEIELYDMTYSVLFEGRETSRGIQRVLSPTVLGSVVSYLAYELKTRAGLRGVPDSEFRSLLRASGQLSEDDVPYLGDTLTSLDLPVRRIPGEDAATEARWSATRDPFSDYLAARWIVDGDTDGEITGRLATMLKTGNFDKGVQYILPLAERRGVDRPVKANLHFLSHQAQLPENTLAAIAEVLA